ncbi:MAG: ThuA domain-containing protein [Pirellulaceae bacterium]
MTCRWIVLVLAWAALALPTLSLPALAEDAKEKPSAAKPKEGGYRILMVTQSKGFVHGSVKRKEANLAPAERAVTEIGVQSNLFRVDCTQDCAADFTKENLQNFDIVFFYTTGNLPISDEAKDYFFNDWLKQKGHGFIGAHSATDTFHNYQPYWDMIGGTFTSHPWNAGDTVAINVHDREHPASKPWGETFQIKDEIYRFKNWQPEKVRVLMSLDLARSPDKSQALGDGPYHVPILWVKDYGDGKVMHMSLGHNEAVWNDETYRTSLLGGIRWALNLEPGSAQPNPELSAEQEQQAQAAVQAMSRQ